MKQQRRPLSGMVNGFPVAVTNAAEVELHEFDAAPASDSNGRPAVDVVTLVIANQALAAASVFVVAGGVTLELLVPANGIVEVFDEQPFGLPANAPGGQTITAQCAANEGPVTAWGWFVRFQG